MSYEMIAIMMFSSMMLMLMTGQRVFGVIGGVAAVASLALWGTGGSDLPFSLLDSNHLLHLYCPMLDELQHSIAYFVNYFLSFQYVLT